MSQMSPGTAGSAGRALEGRLVLLGVTGSIAAYKAAELARGLGGLGAQVQVLMTPAAERFIGALTLEALTGRRVMRDPLELLPDGRIGHIVAADSCDAILVAPATARWLAAMSNGLADDVITATCLASAAPVIVAPAMDGEMYAHPATRTNVERLASYGYRIVEPEVGPLASGQVGEGRLAGAQRILDAVVGAVAGRAVRERDPAVRPPVSGAPRGSDLEGRRIVVTAGGTAEPIDPVRFIGNRSTGLMGVSVAEAALSRGADVTLIAGMTSVPLPGCATTILTPTAEEMRSAVLDALDGADALVMAAAVGDFRPRAPAGKKLTRENELVLELEPTRDILAEVGRRVREARAVVEGPPNGDRRVWAPVLVGFAAETGSLARVADKARRKGVDMLLANDVTEHGSGFGSATNRVTLVLPDGREEAWPLLPKEEVAHRLLDRIAGLLAERMAPDGVGQHNALGRARGSPSAPREEIAL